MTHGESSAAGSNGARLVEGVIPRISLYWHNGRSLGHTAESARVARGLIDVMPGAAITTVSGARHGLDRFPAEVDIVKLPSFKSIETPDTADGFMQIPVLPLTEREFRRVHERLIEAFFESFRPHAVVINHLPQGSARELAAILPKLNGTLRILTLRGILSDHQQTHATYFNPIMASYLTENFDAISIHTDPDVFRLEDYYEIPDSVVELFRYSGYVVEPVAESREEARRSLGVAPDERLVVASLGGGEGAIDVWRAVLAAFDQVSAEVDRFLIAAGPYTEDEVVRELELRAETMPKLRVVRYAPDLIRWMLVSDAFVGAAGHNTIGEVLATAANAVLIPRQRVECEQRMHTTLLAEKGIIRVVQLDDVASRLSDELQAALAEPLDPTSGIRLGGGKTTGRLVRDLLFGKVAS